MIFSENFLSVEIFLEWKWVFMTCRGRTILRTLCPKPIECLVFCSDGVPCDIQKTLYISLVISHLIYASQVLSPYLHGSIHLRQYKGGRFILRGFELLTLCYFLLGLLLLFHCINGKIGFYISEFVRLSHSETHCGSSGVDLRLTLLAHLANHILSVSALLLSPVASVEQFSKFIWRTYCMFVQSTFDLENICSWRIFPICRSSNVDSACSYWPGHREVAQEPRQNFSRAPMTS
jgi:hypothetical protein